MSIKSNIKSLNVQHPNRARERENSENLNPPLPQSLTILFSDCSPTWCPTDDLQLRPPPVPVHNHRDVLRNQLRGQINRQRSWQLSVERHVSAPFVEDSEMGERSTTRIYGTFGNGRWDVESA
ncbi:unnamed protein product [Sphenostylis stenocarpa]|uniref:Uncharacterized protein n=1 Tax=Sphenostylis stenocarpa TaxID=92480 RepID=A0AA86T694_9FABA|nr:unnamed protein product [Sphenostylis stenocarpa]